MKSILASENSMIGKSGTGVTLWKCLCVAALMAFGLSAHADNSEAVSFSVAHDLGFEIEIELDPAQIDELLVYSGRDQLVHAFALEKTMVDGQVLVHGSGTGASVQVHGSGTGNSILVHGSGTGSPLSFSPSAEVWGLVELMASDQGHILVVHRFYTGQLEELLTVLLGPDGSLSVAVD